ncbi:zinc transporter ZIP11-like [Centruroides sculpturatus]|uniref:zinc transporter ZIP11-like n=1 Tax=Centruroides sculpturatus TaxID=218467 RepID=UPI000C6EAB25|nr:zinc transporter ZIP11-like [Centruroides sculpturatus]
MLRGYSPVYQAFLGTLFTWGLTAAGASLVFFFNSKQQRILDCSLGFAAGVMIAASYWSLLEPAIEIAEKSGDYGAHGEWAFVPVAVGFLFGAFFVYAADVCLTHLNGHSPYIALALKEDISQQKEKTKCYQNHELESVVYKPLTDYQNKSLHHRSITTKLNSTPVINGVVPEEKQEKCWQRILLLILAITVHNIPEGLAVGVGFGAVNKTQSATFESARNLAIGIGIQNFPEGLAVSLPLRAVGVSSWKSFWFGQLSGLVEPVAGVIGAIGVTLVEPALPYALAFAAGAMIYVVIDDIIPEAQISGNTKLASWSSVLGFLIMMALDVGLG